MSQNTNFIENEFADIAPYDNYLLTFSDTETKKMLKDDGLSILNHVEMSSDQEVLGYGIRLILLNVGISMIVVIGIKKRF
jgi:hypothetical protein